MTLETKTAAKEKPLKRTYSEQKRYGEFAKDENGNDKYDWRIWFEYADRSKTYTTTKNLKSENDCIKLLASLETQELNKVGMFATVKPTEPKVLTFRSYVEGTYQTELLNSTKKSAHPGKKSEMKLLVEYFGDTPLTSITEDDCLKFKEYIKSLPVRRNHRITKKVFNPETKRHKTVTAGYEPRETPRAVSTSNHYLKRLQGILNKAYRKKKISERVDFENFIDTGEEAVRDITITFEQHHALLDACKGVRGHLRLVLIGLFETGARLCELKGITKRDINLDTQFGWFENSKRRKKSKTTWRMVYISNYFKRALLECGFEQLGDDDFVFQGNAKGNNKNSWSVVRRDALNFLKKNEKKLFDSSLTMKDYRHTHYSNLLQAEISESIADRQIAHGLHEKITRRVYGNKLKDDYLFSQFQKYEEYSRNERRKADISF